MNNTYASLLISNLYCTIYRANELLASIDNRYDYANVSKFLKDKGQRLEAMQIRLCDTARKLSISEKNDLRQHCAKVLADDCIDSIDDILTFKGGSLLNIKRKATKLTAAENLAKGLKSLSRFDVPTIPIEDLKCFAPAKENLTHA